MKNFDYEFKYLEDKLKALNAEFKDAVSNTKKVLAQCATVGIKCVSLGKNTKRIKSADWTGSFGPGNSAFADEIHKGRPAIWAGVPEEFKAGCGNSGQYQLKHNANLIEGVYELKAGKWKKVE